MKTLDGVIVSGRAEKVEVFNWTDPSTGQVKPLRSVKMLLAHGDGTVSRESLSIPGDMPAPDLNLNEIYSFPVTLAVNKKRQVISYTLRPDRPPFLAPELT